MANATFWSAFWLGVGAGLLFAFVVSAVATVIFLMVVADSYEQEDAEANTPTKLHAVRGGKS